MVKRHHEAGANTWSLTRFRQTIEARTTSPHITNYFKLVAAQLREHVGADESLVGVAYAEARGPIYSVGQRGHCWTLHSPSTPPVVALSGRSSHPHVGR